MTTDGTRTVDDEAITRGRLANPHLTGPGISRRGCRPPVQAENHDKTIWAVAARTMGITVGAFAAA